MSSGGLQSKLDNGIMECCTDVNGKQQLCIPHVFQSCAPCSCTTHVGPCMLQRYESLPEACCLLHLIPVTAQMCNDVLVTMP